MMLFKHWDSINLDKVPIVHNEDLSILNARTCLYNNYSDYVKSKEFNNKENPFHLGLIPVPYMGNVSNADIYILLLNPGFSVLNYYEEYEVDEVRLKLVANLKQDIQDDFPLFFLNPKYLWTGGGQYWSSKLESVLNEVMVIKKVDYSKALMELSNRIAILELIPYHSKKYDLKGKYESELGSRAAMLKYVNDVVVPKAVSDDAVIIVTRKVDQWNLPDHKNIIKYGNSEARSAHLTVDSRGGAAIIERIMKKNFA